MSSYRETKITIAFDISFTIDSSDMKSENEVINEIITKKEEIYEEVEKTLTRLDCEIYDRS